MGIVKYKFTFDENKINMPIMIAFGYQLANIESDSENKIGDEGCKFLGEGIS